MLKDAQRFNSVAAISTLVLMAAFIGLYGCVPAYSSVRDKKTTPYFPPAAFQDVTGFDREFIGTFEQHLSYLNEAPLSNSAEFAIRITWISPFDGDSMIRIEQRTHDSTVAIYKRFFPAVASRPGESCKIQRTLKRADLEKIKAEIRDKKFFSLTNEQLVASTDGPLWLVEIADGTHYHAVYRIGPADDQIGALSRFTARVAHVELEVRQDEAHCEFTD